MPRALLRMLYPHPQTSSGRPAVSPPSKAKACPVIIAVLIIQRYEQKPLVLARENHLENKDTTEGAGHIAASSEANLLKNASRSRVGLVDR